MVKKQDNKDKKTESFGKQIRKSNIVSHKDDSFINENVKTDILAIVLIIVGVALFAVSLIPTDAPVSAFVVLVLRYILGVGIYILPFALVVFGGSFFFKMDRQKIPIRVCIGLSLIFIAILTIISLCSPTLAISRPQGLFDVDNIINFGGLIGSSFAWLGFTLLGSIVSIILMIGVIVTGLVIIGLSITKIISRINERKKDIEREREEINRQMLNGIANDKSNIDIINSKDANNLKTRAINNNSGKKPGLKTRIMGFNNNTEDQFAFDPKQNNTSQLPNINNKNANKISELDNKKIKNTAVLLSSKQNSNDDSKNNNKVHVVVSAPKPMDGFELPSFSILKKIDSNKIVDQSYDSLKKTAEDLKTTLQDFGIQANVVGWIPGPTVTLFKVDLPAGVRVNRITALNDDIALALAAPGVRVFAPIPNTTYVGIEVPNENRQTVILSEVLSKAKRGPLQISIGKDVEGNAIVADLAKMPHLLIGGTTGSGKSVSINAMIMSILMRSTPSEVRLILIDPKRVEFTPYNDIPHLYVPVVTEPKEAASALSWGVAEMERRLKLFSEHKARNIGAYNAIVQKMSDKEKKETGLFELPYIVIVVDELADLMMAIGKEVEFSISRIAQLARAAGIHLIVATQRPSTNVVTGLIKANITNRIAFNVASGIDSRVILDTGGAESLIGLGDLLFNKPEFAKPLRIQGCFVDEQEISEVVEHLKSQGKPDYHNDILKTNLISVDSGGNQVSTNASDDDTLFWDAAEMIVNAQHGSTSSLQRRFKIGYARAGRIMDMLEEKGIVGPQNGSKPREVLVDSLELEGIKVLEGKGSNIADKIIDSKYEEMNSEIMDNDSESIEEIQISTKEDVDINIAKDNTINKKNKDSNGDIHDDDINISDIIEVDIEDADINDIPNSKVVNKKIDSKQLIEEDIE